MPATDDTAPRKFGEKISGGRLLVMRDHVLGEHRVDVVVRLGLCRRRGGGRRGRGAACSVVASLHAPMKKSLFADPYEPHRGSDIRSLRT